jgi:hypothetical protein
MAEFNMPKGYDIISYSNPVEWIVYRQQTACKCCGHNPGLMESIHRAKDVEAAQAWLTNHLNPQPVVRAGSECEDRSKSCE